MSSQSENASPSSSIPPPPSGIPPPTGNVFKDAYTSAIHVGDMPCARNSLLGGIVSGVGIGVTRGLTGSAFIAANWAVGAFCLVSTVSFYMCNRKLVGERETVTRVMETLPRRTLKHAEEDSSTPKSQSAS